jgi:hypothetical protein
MICRTLPAAFFKIAICRMSHSGTCDLVRLLDDQRAEVTANRSRPELGGAEGDVDTRGSLAKFGQNQHLLKFPLSTGDAVLVEASPFDKIWGIGMAASDPRARDPMQWCGQSLISFVLIDVREDLRSEVEGETCSKVVVQASDHSVRLHGNANAIR